MPTFVFDVSLATKMKRYFFLFIVIIFFTTCKNDLKLNAPYKEIPSIYAVLCPQERLHIIRVNKVFLGEGDANVMAKVADSVNYPAGELTITLDRYLNGKRVNANQIKGEQSITFHDSLIQTQNGAFSTTQRVYVANADLHEQLSRVDPNYPSGAVNSHSINTNAYWRVSGDYVLTVKNNHTGNVFKAKSTIIDSVKVDQIFAPFVGYYYKPPPLTAPNEFDFISYQGQENMYSIRYPINDSKVYQVVVRLHFYDDYGAQGQGPFRYVDYPFANQNLDVTPKSTVAGISYYKVEFKGKDLFNYVGTALGKMGLDDNGPRRKMYKIEYLIYSSTQDYADYLEFSKPSFGINQSKPYYSNFENQSALGIFTFKSRCGATKAMDPGFVDEFQRNASTCRYNFYNTDESRHGCQ